MVILGIKIKVDNPSIPVVIGELKFEFDTSDESIKTFYEDHERITKEMQEAELNKDNYEAAKGALRKGYDFFLGEGAFEKIHKQTPSLPLLAGYFLQLGESIAEELKDMGLTESQREKAMKYAKSKKKK